MKHRQRAGVTVLGLSTVVAFSSTAWSRPPAAGLALGVERVFGIVGSTASVEAGETTTTRSSVGFSLGNAGLSQGASELDYVGSYTLPRLGGDYILDSGLSFGAALGLSTFGVEREADLGAVSASTENSVTNLLFAPRVGYLFGLGEQFGVWPRGGFSVIHSSVDRDVGADSSLTFGAITLEAPLVFFPRNFIGLMATPALDLGISGSREEGGEDQDGDWSLTEYGLTLGLFVVL